jgi:hypothetical protein
MCVQPGLMMLGSIEEYLALDTVRLAVFAQPLDRLAIEFLPEDMQANGLKPIAWIQACPAPMGRTAGQDITVGMVVTRHT